MYQLKLSRRAEKFLNNRLSSKQYALIRKHLNELSDNPHPPGSIKMKGEDHVYRFRAGDYRIIYEILQQEITILVLKIGHRKDIYR